MADYEILRDSLKEWVDFDGAMPVRARCLGIMGEEVATIRDAKPTFWTENPTSSLLLRILDELVKGARSILTNAAASIAGTRDMIGVESAKNDEKALLVASDNGYDANSFGNGHHAVV